LVLDVFAVPVMNEVRLFWRSAFEELPGDVHASIVVLQRRSLKQVFPPETPYVAVSFHDGKGIAKIWEGGSEPRRMAVEVVAGLWREAGEDPPQGLAEAVENFTGWPE
jgi:hypothetical protein